MPRYRWQMGRPGRDFVNIDAIAVALREVAKARELVCDRLVLGPVDVEATSLEVESSLRRAEVLLTLAVSLDGGSWP